MLDKVRVFYFDVLDQQERLIVAYALVLGLLFVVRLGVRGAAASEELRLREIVREELGER